MMPGHEASLPVRRLADYLKTMEVGGLITYDTLDAVLGMDSRSSKGRKRVHSAQAIANREAGIAFEVSVGKGYRRLPPNEVPAVVGTTGRRRIRSAARRTGKTILRAVVFSRDAFTEDALRRADREMTAANFIEMAARDKTVEAMEEPAQPMASVADLNRMFAESFRKAREHTAQGTTH